MKHFVVINQHGSNRGDEAACRGIIYGLTRAFPDSTIDIFCMYPLDIHSDDRVHLHSSVRFRGVTIRKGIRALLSLIRIVSGIGMTGDEARLAKALRKADLVISAPGGPYIGDLYTYTEFEVMYHFFAARYFKKQYMIYAPSMGPFQIKWRNKLRRLILSRAAAITVREDKSAAMLKSQLGIIIPDDRITCDSALQKPVAPPSSSLDQFTDSCRDAIGFIPLEPERFETEEERSTYSNLLVSLIQQIVDKYDCRIVMFPQGYAEWHDQPFLEKLCRESGREAMVTVLPPTVNSDDQQSLIGTLRAMVSFRYHPGIFAVRQAVPTVSIAYEHKARGFMAAAGLSEFCLDLDGITADKVLQTLMAALNRREQIVSSCEERIDPLVALSYRNSQIAAALIQEKE